MLSGTEDIVVWSLEALQSYTAFEQERIRESGNYPGMMIGSRVLMFRARLACAGDSWCIRSVQSL